MHASESTWFFCLFKLHCFRGNIQKQQSRSVLREKCSENMQQIYRRLAHNEVWLWHGCSPVKLLHIFRTPFPRLFLNILSLKGLKDYTYVLFSGIYVLPSTDNDLFYFIGNWKEEVIEKGSSTSICEHLFFLTDSFVSLSLYALLILICQCSVNLCLEDQTSINLGFPPASLWIL